MNSKSFLAKIGSPHPLEFYSRKTDEVAKELLGNLLIRNIDGILMAGRIVEVEAYFGPGDPASHACKGPTPRSSIMFGRAGIAYVYLNYGVHHLLNIVTDIEGRAGAVLLRAIEPVLGVDRMRVNRPDKHDVDLTNGPGKLTKAIGVSVEENGLDMTVTESGLYVTNDRGRLVAPEIVASERIGISDGKDMLLRFSIVGNPYAGR